MVNDEVIGIGVVAFDITDRKKSEEVNRRLAAIVENSDDAMFASTPRRDRDELEPGAPSDCSATPARK